jgi:hypothetical protein
MSGGRSLVERDKTLSAIQSVLYRKKKLLMDKFQQLKENVKDNEYLNEITDIYEDIPAKQVEILQSLSTYLQSIIDNTINTMDKESAKYDQQLILSKIAELHSVNL